MKSSGDRPSRFDVAVAAGAVVLGTTQMLTNIFDMEVNASWAALVLFVGVTAPLAWRRVWPLTAIAVSGSVLALHGVAFGEMIRCGAALPVLFVFGYTAATRLPLRDAVFGLALVLASGVGGTAWESEFGFEVYPMIAIVSVGAWVVGRAVRSRTRMADELTATTEELRRRRDERAHLEVSVDRARLSGALDSLLQTRLDELAQLAAAGADAMSPDKAMALLTQIEEGSRETLDSMRSVVGALRGSTPLGPAPALTHIDGLLLRTTTADARLRVEGNPRTLPAAVELSAYRIVEHLVAALAQDPKARIDVGVHFEPGALEIRVAGPVRHGADLGAAIDRARQRALLLKGSVDARVSAGRAEAIAQLPALAAP